LGLVSGVSAVSRAVRAPAKVNLSLRVVGKRIDGYHELESLIAPVAIYDDVHVEVRPSVNAEVCCTVSGDKAVPGGAANIAARAAQAVLEQLEETAAVSIRLVKRIPSQAGLGGGSSDAAAVLRVLPGLLGRRLPAPTVARLALELGADVPFFVSSRPAMARGVGERLSFIDLPYRGSLLVVVPPLGVDTAWAFSNAVKSLTSRGAGTRLLSSLKRGAALEGLLVNDLQEGVCDSFPEVSRSLDLLMAVGASAAVMSGSGSAVVGLFRDGRAARRAACTFAGPVRVFVTRILRRSPGGRP